MMNLNSFSRFYLRRVEKQLLRRTEKFPLEFVSSVNAARQKSFAAVDTASAKNEQTSVSKEEIKLGIKVQKGLKRKQKTSFLKGLFVGEFDKDILSFPEVLDKSQLASLDELSAPVQKFFQNVDSLKIDQEGKIPDNVLQTVKDLGLFGLQIPSSYGGLGLNTTEYIHIIEAVGTDASIFTTLSAHQGLGVKGILLFGNEQQKVKYLPNLATGKHIAAFCLTEPSSGSDAASIQCKAVLSPDKKHYHINGEKIWITNGGIADIFIVFAKTEVYDVKGKTEKVSAFIVERSFGGITNGPPEDKLGIRGSNTCSVYFDNVAVPIKNVLGEVGEGFKVAVTILNNGRLSMGTGIAASFRNVLEVITDHIIHRKQFNKPLAEFELIQEKVAKIACSIYAMESMAYLTAGIIDEYDSADCAVESAAVKVFSSEYGVAAANECMQILGGLGYMRGSLVEQVYRDIRITQIFEGTNEILRLFISLMGCQYAGMYLADTVRKLRNPFFNPGFTFSKMWQRRRHLSDSPKLELHLYGHLHPRLKLTADWLEYCVLRLQFIVEVVLSRHGKEITEHQMELRKLADIVIDIYGMTAVLARSSRSYCIGLQNAEHEIHLAEAFCYDAHERIKHNIKELQGGPLSCSELHYKRIASTIVKNKGYCASHPLKRNW